MREREISRQWGEERRERDKQARGRGKERETSEGKRDKQARGKEGVFLREKRH